MQDITSSPTASSPGLTPPPERFNAAAHLLALNAGRGPKLAYIDDLHDLSYGELAERVRRCAAGLLALGVKREERVLMLMHDSVDWPVAFLGALYAGIVPVPVNTLLSTDDYAYMVEHSAAQAVLVSRALWPVLQGAVAAAGRPVPVVVAGGGEAPAGTRRFAALLEAAPLAAPADTRADDFGFWLYSSGSTGRPKGAVHTHANLYWTAALYGTPVLGLHEADIGFSAAKLFFAYGLGNALTFPLSVGATTVLMAERPTPAAVFKRWVERGVTVFFGAPTGYAGMLASPDLPARAAVRLRLCSSAGEALPREIGERFTQHFGCEIVDGLGSTEMLHIFLSNRPGQVQYGSSGRVVPGYRLKLVDEHGGEAKPGEIGDLYVSGPSSALMYWGQRDKSRATFLGEWTRTGDKYSIDDRGCYVYAGRSDDMLKVSGMYVSPFEVEATLMQHAAVLECAVIGIADADGLTKTKAFVV
ncbi:MAG TPA: benzoate-CoA ligase family protein, partial [Burkholderiaceae bacterium]|nr:benzoate-CoA ligase family protein [Burkholderiaceae bacterium]